MHSRFNEEVRNVYGTSLQERQQPGGTYPKEFSIKEDELYIQRIGTSLVLTPKEDIWRSFEESIDSFSEDLFEDGRAQPGQQERQSL
mgnify:CR=1 FL=1